ncbi:ficolin-1-like [Patella vulgata]|uniref:ficolin-1-like n=1 Tax=Patella vulgata TaxID=6465 RepID=UPI0024A9375D|nr:ficolin-1-like [Patella vulgata]
MKSSGGRTLLQHHESSSFYFNRTWQEYKDGFGSLTSDHWLGLDKLYYLTNRDSLTAVKNQYFSTYDNDNDNSSRNCALDMRSGWWYNDCAPCNPNGELLKPNETGD